MSAPRRPGVPAWFAARSARTTPGLAALVVLVVATLCGAGALAPALWAANQADGIAYALAEQDPALRDPTASVRGLPDDWDRLAAELAEHREAMPDVVRAATGDAEALVLLDTADTRPGADRGPAPRTRTTVAFDPAFRERFRLVAGDWPRPGGTGADDAPLEVVLAAEVARSQDWATGEQRTVRYPDAGDASSFREVAVRVTGIVDALDPADGGWRHTPTALEPEVIDDGFNPPIFIGLAYADPGDLALFSDLPGVAATVAWYPLHPERVDAARAAELGPALRAFGAQSLGLDLVRPEAGSFRPGAGEALFGSSAPTVLSRFLERSDALAALLVVVIGGPLGVALLVLLLAIRLVAVRRRDVLALVETRGASRRQLGALLALEGGGLAAVGAALGLLAASLVAPLSPVAVGLALAAVLVAAAGCAAIGLRALAAVARADAAGSPLRDRLVDAGILVVAAVLATLAVLRDHGPARPDPVLAAVPLAVAALGAVLALRLLRVVLDGASRAGRRRTGAVLALGTARARRDPALGMVPVLALVVGVAMAVFPAGVAATVEGGIDTAARAVVGADVRVRAPYLTPDQLARIAALDGVVASAPLYADERLKAEVASGREDVTVYVVDTAELRAVQEGRPGPFPVDGLDGEEAAGIPAVVSATLADLAAGQGIEIGRATLAVVGVAPDASPFGSAGRWIVVDRAHASEVGIRTLASRVTFLRTDEGQAEAVRAAAERLLAPHATAVTPDSVSGQRRADPLVSALGAALGLVIAVDAVLLGLAVGLALVLAGESRRRVLGVLTALGSPRRAEAALLAWEVAPPLLVALPLGLATGSALLPLVAAALDLTPFTGGSVQPAPDGGGGVPVLLAIALLGVAAVAAAIALLLDRRRGRFRP